MQQNNDVVICDNCHCNIERKQIEFNSRYANVAGNKLYITYFKCGKCGKPFITEILDWVAVKKKQKYLSIQTSITRKVSKGYKVSDRRMQDMKDAWNDLLSYEFSLKNRYKDIIPRSVFED